MPEANQQQQQQQQRSAADIEAEIASADAAERARLDSEALTGDGKGGQQPPNQQQQLSAEDAERLDFEEQASRKGWVPKDKFTGPADKWVDAKTFVKRGEQFTKNLQREVTELRGRIEQFEGTRKAFVKFHEETIAAKDKQIAEQIRQLKVQRNAATRDGDDETAVDLEERIDALSDQRKELNKPIEQTGDDKGSEGQGKDGQQQARGPNMNDPVINEWMEDGNEWFKDDETLRNYALELGEGMIKEGFNKRGRPFLDAVAEKMRENFPRKFKAFDAKRNGGEGNGNGNARQSNVEGDSAGGGGGRAQLSAVNGKTERDLPAEDLKLMRQFIKEGWTTREKFLTSYFSR